MAFGIEDVERVVYAFLKAKRVEVNCARNLLMLATDIHDEAVVDEHPHVIVTEEFEVLARNVFERCLDLHGETVIMSLVTAASEIVKVGVQDSLFGIEVLEVIEQEEAAFWAGIVFLAKPETVILEL